MKPAGRGLLHNLHKYIYGFLGNWESALIIKLSTLEQGWVLCDSGQACGFLWC
ncbi:protein of unknown function [Methylocaldum szegediense]|uniref:Uncharacterized protein n=1 Tax=Methylocaldum szegediense TaxID=73780 RepID=A0ABM9HXZ3_9GAMM|nr:protein of unknown function [Methylocaldum szegediense]